MDRCPLAPVRGAEFVRCIPMLHKRTEAEGSGTDHTAALKRALEILDAPGGEDLFKMVFLITDGGLNVDNSPQYGRDDPPGARDAEARRQLVEDVLPEANRMGIQVWPLGFGGGIDEPGLEVLAEGGAGANPECDEIEQLAGPAPLVAETANRIGPTILNAVANATSSKPEATEEGVVEEGGTVTLDVEVPITASTGSINVEKRHPAIEVAFIDPKGRDVTNRDELDGSTFTLGGGTSTAASLGVTHPLPGTWKVRFTSKPGVPQQNVTALWKDLLNSSVILDPVAPAPGEPLTVRVRLLTSRDEPITDETMLDPMIFSAVLRGEGFDPIPVPLNDEGAAPDRTAGDGEFAGQVVVPASATGGLCVEGAVFTPGLEGDIRSYCTRPPGERSGGAIIALSGGEVAPGWGERNWPVFPLTAAGLLLLAVLLLLLRRRALERADIQQLSVRLDHNEKVVGRLDAPKRRSSAFVFDIRDNRGEPALDHAKGAGRHHVVRRGKNGMLTLTLPNGGREFFRDMQPVPLPHGLAVVVRDGRITSGGTGGEPGGTDWGDVSVADPDEAPETPANLNPDPDAAPIQDAAPVPVPATPSHPPPTQKVAGVRLFVSYSHRDERYRERLRISLAGLRREGRITVWDDRMIVPGVDWDEEINSRLETAEMVILLVTPDFLDSDYAYGKEATRALVRYREGSLRLIPVIVRPSDWEHSPLGQLQALPPGAEPISRWPDQDEAWLAVARGVRQAILGQADEEPDLTIHG